MDVDYYMVVRLEILIGKMVTRKVRLGVVNVDWLVRRDMREPDVGR